MKDVISNTYLRMALPLLCLFALITFGCSSLKNVNNRVYTDSGPIFQIIVREEDIPIFLQRMHEMNLTPKDIRQVAKNIQDNEAREFCISFRFSSSVEFLIVRSAILSTGLVRQIN